MQLIGGKYGRNGVLSVCVVLGACVSAGRTPPPNLELGRASVADLMGQTPQEIVARLGGPPSNQVFVSKVHLEGEVRVVEGSFLDFVGEACRRRDAPRPYFYVNGLHEERNGRSYGNAGVIETTFQDGRLVALRNLTSVGDGGAIPRDTQIVLSCVPHVGGDPGQDFAFGALAILGAPVFGPLTQSRRTAVREHSEVLADLRLGDAPPGGLDAFVASHSDIIEVTARDGDSAELHIMIDKDQAYRPYATARVVGGRVTELIAPLGPHCRLSAEGALRCEPGD